VLIDLFVSHLFLYKVLWLRSEGPSPAWRRASPGWAKRGLGIWFPSRWSAASATHGDRAVRRSVFHPTSTIGDLD